MDETKQEAGAKFKIVVTCPDCTGEDFYGCGEGYPWDYGEPDLFDTREAAQAKADALSAERYGGIWDFEVKQQEPPARPPALSTPRSDNGLSGKGDR